MWCFGVTLGWVIKPPVANHAASFPWSIMPPPPALASGAAVAVVVVRHTEQLVVACGVYVEGGLRGVGGGLVDAVFDHVLEPPLPALHLSERLGAPERGSVYLGGMNDKRG